MVALLSDPYKVDVYAPEFYPMNNNTVGRAAAAAAGGGGGSLGTLGSSSSGGTWNPESFDGRGSHSFCPAGQLAATLQSVAVPAAGGTFVPPGSIAVLPPGQGATTLAAVPPLPQVLGPALAQQQHTQSTSTNAANNAQQQHDTSELRGAVRRLRRGAQEVSKCGLQANTARGVLADGVSQLEAVLVFPDQIAVPDRTGDALLGMLLHEIAGLMQAVKKWENANGNNTSGGGAGDQGGNNTAYGKMNGMKYNHQCHWLDPYHRLDSALLGRVVKVVAEMLLHLQFVCADAQTLSLRTIAAGLRCCNLARNWCRAEAGVIGDLCNATLCEKMWSMLWLRFCEQIERAAAKQDASSEHLCPFALRDVATIAITLTTAQTQMQSNAAAAAAGAGPASASASRNSVVAAATEEHVATWKALAVLIETGNKPGHWDVAKENINSKDLSQLLYATAKLAHSCPHRLTPATVGNVCRVLLPALTAVHNVQNDGSAPTPQQAGGKHSNKSGKGKGKQHQQQEQQQNNGSILTREDLTMVCNSLLLLLGLGNGTPTSMEEQQIAAGWANLKSTVIRESGQQLIFMALGRSDLRPVDRRLCQKLSTELQQSLQNNYKVVIPPKIAPPVVPGPAAPWTDVNTPIPTPANNMTGFNMKINTMIQHEASGLTNTDATVADAEQQELPSGASSQDLVVNIDNNLFRIPAFALPAFVDTTTPMHQLLNPAPTTLTGKDLAAQAAKEANANGETSKEGTGTMSQDIEKPAANEKHLTVEANEKSRPTPATPRTAHFLDSEMPLECLACETAEEITSAQKGKSRPHRFTNNPGARDTDEILLTATPTQHHGLQTSRRKFKILQTPKVLPGLGPSGGKKMPVRRNSACEPGDCVLTCSNNTCCGEIHRGVTILNDPKHFLKANTDAAGNLKITVNDAGCERKKTRTTSGEKKMKIMPHGNNNKNANNNNSNPTNNASKQVLDPAAAAAAILASDVDLLRQRSKNRDSVSLMSNYSAPTVNLNPVLGQPDQEDDGVPGSSSSALDNTLSSDEAVWCRTRTNSLATDNGRSATPQMRERHEHCLRVKNTFVHIDMGSVDPDDCDICALKRQRATSCLLDELQVARIMESFRWCENEDGSCDGHVCTDGFPRLETTNSTTETKVVQGVDEPRQSEDEEEYLSSSTKNKTQSAGAERIFVLDPADAALQRITRTATSSSTDGTRDTVASKAKVTSAQKDGVNADTSTSVPAAPAVVVPSAAALPRSSSCSAASSSPASCSVQVDGKQLLVQ